MAAGQTCFKLLLLYLHLTAFFGKADSPKGRPNICSRSEACFDTFWGSTGKDGLDCEGFCWFYSEEEVGAMLALVPGEHFVLLPKRNRTHGCLCPFYS